MVLISEYLLYFIEWAKTNLLKKRKSKSSSQKPSTNSAHPSSKSVNRLIVRVAKHQKRTFKMEGKEALNHPPAEFQRNPSHLFAFPQPVHELWPFQPRIWI